MRYRNRAESRERKFIDQTEVYHNSRVRITEEKEEPRDKRRHRLYVSHEGQTIFVRLTDEEALDISDAFYDLVDEEKREQYYQAQEKEKS